MGEDEASWMARALRGSRESRMMARSRLGSERRTVAGIPSIRRFMR